VSRSTITRGMGRGTWTVRSGSPGRLEVWGVFIAWDRCLSKCSIALSKVLESAPSTLTCRPSQMTSVFFLFLKDTVYAGDNAGAEE
jgi:hypothetical protein